jgi:hypothetical protein
LVGPILGACLFSIGGFAVPFLFFAVIQIVSFPLFLGAFTKAHRENKRLLSLEL